jgi:hypothetical protein
VRGQWNFQRAIGVIEVVRKGLIAAGVLVSVVLAVSLYLPRRGQAALDAAYGEYLRCRNIEFIIDCYPDPCSRMAYQAYCLQEYLDRREAIRRRYFFFQTVATHL